MRTDTKPSSEGKIKKVKLNKENVIGYKRVPIDDLEPNNWNPNRLQGRMLEKLETNLQRTFEATGILPPVVVREHPDQHGKWQIIDGYHRWTTLRSKLGHTDIDIFVLDVDDKMARVLTENLNHLRGEDDPMLRASLFAGLIDEGMTLEEMQGLLPQDSNEIIDLLTVYGDGAALKALLEQDDGKPEEDKPSVEEQKDDLFVEMRFRVSVSQAQVIQEEIDRISGVLRGQNLDGRALELMAVQSGQTELPPELAREAQAFDAKAKEERKATRDKKKATKKAPEPEPEVVDDLDEEDDS